jgi:hypothetical protein
VAYAAHVARRRGLGSADVRGAGVEAQLTLEVEKVQTLAKSMDALRIWKDNNMDMLTIS